MTISHYADLEDISNNLEDEFHAHRTPSKLTWAVDEIDQEFGKPVKEDLIILCGESGSGKTEFAMNMLEVNVRKGNKILFVSLEMTVLGMIKRRARRLYSISMDDFEARNYTPKQFVGIKNTIELYTKSPLLKFVEHDYNQSGKMLVEKVVAVIEQETEEFGNFDLIFIDALQFIGGQSTDKRQNIESIIQELLTFVNSEGGAPIVLIHHFTKGGDGQRDRPRSINNLKDSAEIEHKATKVVQIWRNTSEGNNGEIAFLQQKDRFEGLLGKVDLSFANGTYHGIMPQ
jgi:replicative DNA helicase